MIDGPIRTGFQHTNRLLVVKFRMTSDNELRKLLVVAGIVAAAAMLASHAMAESPRRLTEDGRPKMTPVFTDGGRSLVYTAETRFNQWSLLRIPFAAKTGDSTSGGGATSRDSAAAVSGAAAGVMKPEALHPAATTSELAGSFSADGTIVAFVRNDGNLHVRLVIENRVTGATAEVDPGGGFAGIQYAKVAPSGSHIVFAFPERGGSQQLFQIRSDGSNKQPLTAGEGFDSCPAFSPDGKYLAFSSSRTGNFEIFIMSLDGKELRQITDHPGLDTHPAWSPDGRKLVYTSLVEGNYDIYLATLDGAPPRRLTTHVERDDYPQWHPSGRQLVTVSERDGHSDLYAWDVE